MDEADPTLAAAGRVPGRRGRATRQRLLQCTAELIGTTPWRSIKVIDIARSAGTSPATFYQYFTNVEAAILVLAEGMVDAAEELAELVEGGWSPEHSWPTAVAVVEGFLAHWEQHRMLFRVVDLASDEGDLRFRGLRVQALNAVTVALARVISAEVASSPAGADPMAVASMAVSMLATVAACRYGYELWGIRTAAMVDSAARMLHWAVTGREAAAEAAVPTGSLPPRTGPVLGGGAAQARRRPRRAHDAAGRAPTAPGSTAAPAGRAAAGRADADGSPAGTSRRPRRA